MRARMTMPGRRLVAALFLVLPTIGFTPQAAAGDPPDQESQEKAQRLFLEGRELLERGNDREACARFEGSLALAERANTLFNVAQCDEKAGRLVAALQRWNRGIALIGANDERATLARERAAALDRRLPRVTIVLSGQVPPGTRVRADGVLLESASLGAPRPMDPGEHALVVEAPGRIDQRVQVQLAEGEQREVIVVPGPADPGRRANGPQNGDKSGPTPPPPGDGDGRRVAGLVVGGLGVAGLIAAGVTGGILVARNDSIQQHCPESRCDAEGRDTIEGSGPLFIVNAVTWGVGLAGVGAGVALLISAGGEPSPKAALAPTALPGGGGFALTGRF